MASVTKRGNTYRIMVSMGYDMAGKQIRKTTTYTPPDGVTEGKGRKLAEAFAHDFEKQCQGITGLKENMRFHELFDWYYDIIAMNKMKETTYHAQRNMIETYVIPQIGNLKLKDITTAHFDELWVRLKENGRSKQFYRLIDSNMITWGSGLSAAQSAGVSERTVYHARGGKNVTEKSANKIAQAFGKNVNEMFTLTDEKVCGLKVNTILDIRNIVSAIFNTAVKKEIITKNPVPYSTPPKQGKNEKPFLDDSQCIRLLEVLEEHKNIQQRIMITTLLYTGLRSGELRALRWEDIDFDNNAIYIRHTLSRIKGEYKLTEPKTEGSERYVTIDEYVMNMLKKHSEWQKERRIEMGSAWTERGAVFTGQYGEWYSGNHLNRTFKLILKKYGFPDFHIHDLRHACVSLMINAGVPVKLIAEQVGHASTRTTEKVYAHIFAKTRTMASEAISKTLRGANK
jgi:integrase